jgi:hypothetical protein
MKHLRLLGLTVLAVFAFASVAAATAFAEEPVVLVLPGETIGGTELTGTSGEGTLETVGKKTIKCTKSKNTDTLEGEGADTAKDKAIIDFEECKEGSANCRSENEKAEKDPIGTILIRTSTLSASFEKEGKLVPGIVFTLLSEPKGGNQIFNCGTLKDEVKGSVGCVVSPGLTEIAAGGTITITCSQKEGKQTNLGTCIGNAVTCEELTKHPLEGALGGKATFEKSGENIVATDKGPKMLFFDD